MSPDRSRKTIAESRCPYSIGFPNYVGRTFGADTQILYAALLFYNSKVMYETMFSDFEIFLYRRCHVLRDNFGHESKRRNSLKKTVREWSARCNTLIVHPEVPSVWLGVDGLQIAIGLQSFHAPFNAQSTLLMTSKGNVGHDLSMCVDPHVSRL